MPVRALAWPWPGPCPWPWPWPGALALAPYRCRWRRRRGVDGWYQANHWHQRTRWEPGHETGALAAGFRQRRSGSRHGPGRRAGRSVYRFLLLSEEW